MKTAPVKFIVSGLVVIGLCSGLLISGASASFSRPNEEVVASFAGFAPDTQISGSIISEAQKPFNSKSSIDKNGASQLRAGPDTFSKKGPLQYDFVLSKDKQRMNVSVTYDDQTDSYAVNASGAKPLSRIVIETINGPLETKSDWAGLFTQDSIKVDSSSQARPFQIAFYGSHLSDADRGMSPNIITVQAYATQYGAAHFADIMEYYVRPLVFMSLEFSTLMLQQALIIGQFIDAKDQLEVQRTLQQLKAEAHKDYHPSDMMCRFGTFTRSLATTEGKLDLDHLAMNSIMMTYYTDEENSVSHNGMETFAEPAQKKFREENCDRNNNNQGIDRLCEHDQDGIPGNDGPDGVGAEEFQRMNADIMYTSTVENPLTLDVDFTDDGELNAAESDLMALAKNLYWAEPLNQATNLEEEDPAFDYDPEQYRKHRYMKSRRLMAMANLAHNSFTQIVAMKARAPEPEIDEPGWIFMKTMMREFGLPDDEIEYLVGEYPSYYAQMDILGKRMYQSPNFYTNLYDKPTNVDRIMASMTAIQLMQQRDFYDSMLRKEMLTSAALEEEIETKTVLLKGELLDMDRKPAQ